MLINDYTYGRQSNVNTKNMTRWRCSTHCNKKCKAMLVTDDKNKIISANYEHDHPPGKYVECRGKYIRI